MPGFEVIDEQEQQAVEQIFTAGKGILFAHGFDQMRDRFRVREFEHQFAEKIKANYAQAVSSGSVALLVALKALGVGPGDEVITQSFTFVATVEAILMLGAIPIITEIDDTYNMDPDDLETKITEKTKVILPVHMAGVPARMDRILAVAKKHGIKVLEDTAQGIGASFDNKPLGTLGDMGAFSLDFGKTITAGEGGVVTSNERSLYQNALAFHDHGHEYNPNVGRADDTRQTWGFNFRMSELNAAVASVQLQKLDHILERSRDVKNKIESRLAAKVSAIQFRAIPEKGIENADAIIFSYPDKRQTQLALANLKEAGLGTKNIPDALKWHFSGYWEHMFQGHAQYADTFATAWPKSQDLLERSVALPVMVNWDDSFIEEYCGKLITALNVG